nr:putative replication associated protein [Crucivirus sp.]
MSEIPKKSSKSLATIISDVVIVKTITKASKKPSVSKASSTPKRARATESTEEEEGASPPTMPKSSKKTKASSATKSHEREEGDGSGPPTKARGWCFTINNYTLEDPEIFRTYAAKIDYSIFGFEVAPTTGTPHMQCYMNHNNTIRFQTIRKLFPRAANIVQAKGTAKHNQRYCKKGEQSKEEYDELLDQGPNYGKNAVWEEFGECPESVGAGHRTDLDIIGDQLRDGTTTVDELARSLPLDTFNRYSRTFAYMQNLYQRERRREGDLQCFFLYGTTGSAKTREYTRGYREDEIFNQLPDSVRFSGYTGQRCFVMNEVRGDVPFRYILGIADPSAPYPIEIKNERLLQLMTATRIVITSCHPPEKLWPDESPTDMLQLHRRYTVVKLDGNRRDVVTNKQVYTLPWVDHPNFLSEVDKWEGTKQEREQRLQFAFEAYREDKSSWDEHMKDTQYEYRHRRLIKYQELGLFRLHDDESLDNP